MSFNASLSLFGALVSTSYVASHVRGRGWSPPMHSIGNALSCQRYPKCKESLNLQIIPPPSARFTDSL